VLDADGHVLDALPGLYGPAAFLEALVSSELLTPQHDRARWYRSQANRILAAWQQAADGAGIVEMSQASAPQPTLPLALSAAPTVPQSLFTTGFQPSVSGPLDLSKVNQPLDFGPGRPFDPNVPTPFSNMRAITFVTVPTPSQGRAPLSGGQSLIARPFAGGLFPFPAILKP
jgi:hypothetical protein